MTLRDRLQHEADERATLAPYAQFSDSSAGRHHPEPRHPFRTEYQRDRARIVHSRAFRRLEGKTQVFLTGTDDHLRTRLTHTIEVASIARSLASALRLNPDLTEAIALAHDLGHSPFSHSGERTLEDLMADHGGFDHNQQSLRIVSLLEHKYPQFDGLNLSLETLEGLRKHAKLHHHPHNPHNPAAPLTHPSPSLEAQITNIADEIAYYSHDLDDGLDFDLLDLDDLDNLDIWRHVRQRVQNEHPGLAGPPATRYAIRCLIDLQVEDVARTTLDALQDASIRTATDVRLHPVPLVRYSEPLLQANRTLRQFLYQKMYFHPRVAEVNQRACRLLREVFLRHLEDPALLTSHNTRPADRRDPHPRTVCDHISGMTDRYLLAEHARLFGSSPETLRIERTKD